MSPERIAFAVGVFCSTVFSAGNLVLIYIGLPALLLCSSSDPTSKARSATPAAYLARQWRLLFLRGHLIMPANAILSATAFFYAGRQLHDAETVQKQLYYLAACFDLAVVPFTLIFIGKTNDELLRRAALADMGSNEEKPRSGTGIETYETADLIRWWGSLGAIRTVFPLMAILAAVAASSDPVSFSGSFSTESVSLFTGAALLIFMVIRFGVPPVEV
jgi:hypothetical protein